MVENKTTLFKNVRDILYLMIKESCLKEREMNEKVNGLSIIVMNAKQQDIRLRKRQKRGFKGIKGDNCRIG